MLVLRYLLLKKNHQIALLKFDELYPAYLSFITRDYLGMNVDKFSQEFHVKYPNINVTYLCAIGIMSAVKSYSRPFLAEYLSSLTKDQFITEFAQFTNDVYTNDLPYRYVENNILVALANQVLKDHSLLPYLEMTPIDNRQIFAYELAKKDINFAINSVPEYLKDVPYRNLIDLIDFDKHIDFVVYMIGNAGIQQFSYYIGSTIDELLGIDYYTMDENQITEVRKSNAKKATDILTKIIKELKNKYYTLDEMMKNYTDEDLTIFVSALIKVFGEDEVKPKYHHFSAKQLESLEPDI